MRNKNNRFKKQPKSGIEKWIEEKCPGVHVTRISSYAHLCRLLYNYGLHTKTSLMESLTRALDAQANALADCQKRGASDGEIADVVREHEKTLDALEEVRGLPDDEPTIQPTE